MSDKKVQRELTPNCKKVLEFLQENDKEWVGADLSAETGVKGIHPVCNSLVINGYVEKGSVTRPFTNKKGETTDKAYVTYRLTAAGRDFRD